jgi:hypothetical protein
LQLEQAVRQKRRSAKHDSTVGFEELEGNILAVVEGNSKHTVLFSFATNLEQTAFQPLLVRFCTYSTFG